MKLEIEDKIIAFIHSHAAEVYPEECCGFLYGLDTSTRIVKEARKVKNNKIGDKRRRYEISPLDYFNAEMYAEHSGQTLLGVYHSHPDHPAKPSKFDLEQAIAFFSYIIISVKNGIPEETTSWRLDDDNQNFKQELINISIT